MHDGEQQIVYTDPYNNTYFYPPSYGTKSCQNNGYGLMMHRYIAHALFEHLPLLLIDGRRCHCAHFTDHMSCPIEHFDALSLLWVPETLVPSITCTYHGH